MVIYLQKIKTFGLKIIIIILIALLVFVGSYIITYFRFDDNIAVEKRALLVENGKLKDENNQLREALGLKDNNGKYIISKVLVRNIHSFYNEIILDKNTDNIEIGNAVINKDGIIGLVSEVKEDFIIVKLLTGDYNLSVKINDTYGNLNNGVVTLLDKYAVINKGDKVYTSGLTGISQNIYVGEVLDVLMSEDNLVQKINIKLLDNQNLNYVAIMVGE